MTDLFPTVPIGLTLKYSELIKRKKEYVKLNELCTSQKCFQMNGESFEQLEAMGNS